MSTGPDPRPQSSARRSFLDAAVGVDYPKLTVDVAITAERGEIIGLVGPNGAGKTTVLRAIAGLQPIDRGCITIDGLTVDDPAHDVLVEPQQRHVGVVFQDYRLFPHLSALDNVAFGLRSRSMDKAQARAEAATWLERLDVLGHQHHKPASLSGGQAQRVALARALATQPRVLLLDEPLAAIDPSARTRIRGDMARHLAGFDGVTLVVSHQHEDIRSLADRALVIDACVVFCTGPGAELTGPGSAPPGHRTA